MRRFEAVKKIRMAMMLSPVEMGKIVGVTRQCIYQWEREDYTCNIKMPHIRKLVSLATQHDLNIGLEDLIN